MKLSRIIIWVLVIAVVGLIGLGIATRAGVFNTRYDDMVKEYAGPPSRFIDVQGVRVHVRDEGTGPAILMLHSSMTNLHVWDAWADVLKRDHRVVRIDWPPYGLTIDNTGKAGMPHAAEIVEGVVEQLKLDKFVLVGSSSGATLSVLYTAAHPDKVRALALSTLPLKTPPSIKTPWKIQMFEWIHDKLFPNYHPLIRWRYFLENLYGDPGKLTDAHIKLFADTNNLEGGYARVGEYYKSNVKGVWSSGAGGYAEKITVPILLQWGDKDPVLPPYLSEEAVAKFKNAKVTLLHYPQGHYPMLEDPTPTVTDLKRFLATLPPEAGPAAPPAATAPAPAAPAQ